MKKDGPKRREYLKLLGGVEIKLANAAKPNVRNTYENNQKKIMKQKKRLLLIIQYILLQK